METFLRQIREFGEAVVVIGQSPSKLGDSIKANTNTKIAFTLGNGSNIDDITGSSLAKARKRRDAARKVVAKALTLEKRTGHAEGGILLLLFTSLKAEHEALSAVRCV